jgi:hypothetical protein
MRHPFPLVVLSLALAAASAPAAGAAAERCGTWRALTPSPGLAPAAPQARPPVGTHRTFSPHFVVHYENAALSGYAQDVSNAAELAYRTMVDTLQHQPPLGDGTSGGDARVDIYLRTTAEMGGPFWGVTYPENLVGAPYANSWNGWVEMVDTLGVERREVVAAHEVHHAVQIAYDRFESVSLLEMLSTWVEERVYDDYNLNYGSIRMFFEQPQRGLFSQTYSNVPWAIYLTEHYGDAIIAETLDACAATNGPNPREAFDAALGAVAGTTFLDEFVRFGTFNYFVGGRDDGEHYSEGAAYGATTVERRSLCYPEPLFVSIHPPATLGANYVLLDGDGYSGPLRLYLYPEYLASTMVSLTRFKGASRVTTSGYYAPASTPVDSITVADWAECDSVLVVYQVDTGSSSNSFAFEARPLPPGIPAGDWLLVLDRDACRAPFDGANDGFSDRDGEETPFATALRALGAGAVTARDLPPDLSNCAGVFVVGGFGDAGLTLSDDELNALGAYMDAGGDVYVEGSRLGEFMDPALGAGSPAAQAFWTRFGCAFGPGNPSGNVTGWHSEGPPPLLSGQDFTYDTGAPDAFVGTLAPGDGAAFIRDQGNAVRGTLREVNGSTRIMSTVLLGGSTGIASSTREAFLNDVLTLFGVQLAALSVMQASVSVDGSTVRIEGLLEHYDGQSLRCERESDAGRADVPLDLRRAGALWRFSARDQLDAGAAVYRLFDTAEGRVIWEARVEARTPPVALRLLSIHPNPAREGVRIAVESAADAAATIGVYDVAGRRVLEQTAALRRGTNTLYLRDLPARSGIYFVRVQSGGRDARGRLLVLR